MSRTSLIFVTCLETMKETLTLAEYALEDRKYKYFKKQVMNLSYESLGKIYRELVARGEATPCECGAQVRNGWSECQLCSGSGYKDTTHMG